MLTKSHVGYFKRFWSGSVTNAGTLNNNLAGVYSGLYNLGQLTNSGTLNNAGRLYNDTGATFTNSGTLASQGNVVIDAGARGIGNSGTVNAARELIASAGDLTNSGTLVAGRLDLKAQTLTNAGGRNLDSAGRCRRRASRAPVPGAGA